MQPTDDTTKRRRYPLALMLICTMLLVVTSCGDDNSTGPANGNGDDNSDTEPPTNQPTFANVQNIFNSSCGGENGCHINSRESGVQLNSYDNIIGSEGVQYDELVVQPGEANESPLIDKISSDSPEYGVRMPQGGPYLSDDEIDLIRNWINSGAENDGDS